MKWDASYLASLFRVKNNKKCPEGNFYNGTPDRIRTYDLLLRKQTLYPAELRVHIY